MTESIDTTTGPEARVRALLDRVLSDGPVFPVEVIVRGRTGSRVVDVFVDSAKPIGADDLAAISRELGGLIEDEDFIRGSYRLNVSTPGADRPLQRLQQFPKHAGRVLSVRRRADDGGEDETLTGTLVRVDGERVVLRLKDGKEQVVPFDSITEARIQLPW